MDRNERQQAFDRDGYVCIAPLFGPDKIAEINAEIRRFIRDVVPDMPASQIYYEDKSDPASLKQLQKMFEHDGYFNDLLMNGPVRDIAQEVLRDQVVAVNMQYFNKPAGTGQATPPHQDGYYFHLTPCEAVTGWLALEDVDEENGCIHYVRGSHRGDGFRPHGQTGVLGFSQGITDFGTVDDRADAVAFPGAAGTFLMHHAKTVHWAGATRSRRALGLIYYAKRARADIKARDAYQKALDARLARQGRRHPVANQRRQHTGAAQGGFGPDLPGRGGPAKFPDAVLARTVCAAGKFDQWLSRHGHPGHVRSVFHLRLFQFHGRGQHRRRASGRPVFAWRRRQSGASALAQANLEALDARARDSSSVAPFDGVVISKMVEVGDTVQPGMPLVTYAYTDYLRIDADIPVRLAAGLSEGMIVPARLDVGGVQVDAKVAQIFPVADPARHTVRVKFDLPYDTPGGPGMYVKVTVPDNSVPVRTEQAIPTEALLWRGSLPSVFVLENGRPSLRIVRVGYPLADGRISVVSGPTGGEQVILNPPASLVSGE